MWSIETAKRKRKIIYYSVFGIVTKATRHLVAKRRAIWNTIRLLFILKKSTGHSNSNRPTLSCSYMKLIWCASNEVVIWSFAFRWMDSIMELRKACFLRQQHIKLSLFKRLLTIGSRNQSNQVFIYEHQTLFTFLPMSAAFVDRRNYINCWLLVSHAVRPSDYTFRSNEWLVVARKNDDKDNGDKLFKLLMRCVYRILYQRQLYNSITESCFHAYCCGV